MEQPAAPLATSDPGGPSIPEAASHLVPVPPMLVSLAAWAWRVTILGVVLVGLVVLVSRLTIVLVPVLAAFFLTALLHRPVASLLRRGWPRGLAAGVVLVLGLSVVGTVVYATGARISAQSTQLTGQFYTVVQHVKDLVGHLPGSSGVRVNGLVDRAVAWLEGHRALVARELVSVGRLLTEVVTEALLALFVTFFFLADGDRMWGWLVRLLPGPVQGSVNGAGYRAWRVLSAWIRGSAVIATIHAVVLGTALWLLGAPLVLPLTMLVFMGGFVPVVGTLVVGAVAVVVTTLTGGLAPGAILVAVLFVEDQLEAHVLQPLIIGRAVRLHPVAILLGLAAGGALGGLLGAIVAVPTIAVVHAAAKYLTGVEDLDGRRLGDVERFAPLSPAQSDPLPGYGPRP